MKRLFLNNQASVFVSKMTWVAIVFIVAAIILGVSVFAFNGPISEHVANTMPDVLNNLNLEGGVRNSPGSIDPNPLPPTQKTSDLPPENSFKLTITSNFPEASPTIEMYLPKGTDVVPESFYDNCKGFYDNLCFSDCIYINKSSSLQEISFIDVRPKEASLQELYVFNGWEIDRERLDSVSNDVTITAHFTKSEHFYECDYNKFIHPIIADSKYCATHDVSPLIDVSDCEWVEHDNHTGSTAYCLYRENDSRSITQSLDEAPYWQCRYDIEGKEIWTLEVYNFLKFSADGSEGSLRRYEEQYNSVLSEYTQNGFVYKYYDSGPQCTVLCGFFSKAVLYVSDDCVINGVSYQKGWQQSAMPYGKQEWFSYWGACFPVVYPGISSLNSYVSTWCGWGSIITINHLKQYLFASL